MKESTVIDSYLMKVMSETSPVQLILNDQRRKLNELLNTLRPD